MSVDTINNVISMRDTLKAGMNWPLRVFSDNNFIVVDESRPYTFTIWDDVNGTIYYLRLVDVMTERHFKNYPEVSVSAVNYDFIQAMEVPMFPTKSLDKLFNSIVATGGTSLNDDMRKFIKHMYSSIVDFKKPTLDSYLVNATHGAVIDDQDDEYYNGRMHVPFKETHTIDLMYNNLGTSSSNNNGNTNP